MNAANMNAAHRRMAPVKSQIVRLPVQLPVRTIRPIRTPRHSGQWLARFKAGGGHMFRSLFNLFLGCSHKKTTFPFTPLRRDAAPNATRNGTYVVCLDCGKELAYNWKEMRLVQPVTARAPIEAQPTRVRA
jgi:hypothetical protein